MSPIRSLNTRLTLTLVLVALVAGTVTAGAILISTSRYFSTYRAQQADRRVAEVQQFLSAYYLTRNTWEGVDRILAPSHEGMMGSMHEAHQTMGMDPQAMPAMMAIMDLGAQRLRLVGADGRTLADTGAPVGATVPREELAAGLPITVDGRLVGTLLIERPNTPPLTSLDQAYTRSVTTSAMVGGAGAALLAGFLGYLFAMRITRPLLSLTQAAGRMARRDLSARVSVTGADEVSLLGNEFNRMAAELERQELLRRTMVADVAHELRTPVAILRAQFEALQDEAAAPSPETLLPMHDEVLRLSRLIDDLQVLSLADAGKLPLQCRKVDPAELADSVSGAFRPAASAKEVAYHCDSPAGLPTLNVDADRIKQVLLNLLGNALRHTEPGGTIRLRLSEGQGQVHFSVTDSGEGIPEADLPHVFDRFYRAEKSRSRSGGGSGLGLSIARGIAEAHGGSISVESKVGEGSSFTLSLSTA